MVGKKQLGFFLFTVSSLLYGSVELVIDSSDHYTAVVGEQFEMNLIVKDLGRLVNNEPIFLGDTPSLLQRTGLYMTSINGKTNVKYTYQVRFDVPGSYTIGPVKIVQGGQEYSSRSVQVNVTYGVSGQAKENKKDIFLELKTNIESPVVGEEVRLELSCFVRKKDVQIESVMEPQLSDIALISDGKPEIQDTFVDGVSYKVVRWNWKFIPERPGELIIPAASIMYVTSGRTAQHFFFSLMSPSKRIFSNALVIPVQELPVYDKIVNGIGSFFNFTAHLSRGRVEQGEAATLTLELEGTGTVIPELKYELSAMPEGVKYYPVAAKKESHGYVFEYVVQAVEAGDFIFPAQEFVFFNTSKKEYELLSTAPIELRITKGDMFALQKDLEEGISEDGNSDQKAVKEDFLSANAHPDHIALWFSQRSSFREIPAHFSLSWIVFFVLLLLLCCLKILLTLYTRVSILRYYWYQWDFFLYCFLYARYRLYRIVQKDDIALLYPLFCEIIARKYECSIDEVYKYVELFSKKDKSIAANSWIFFWQSVSLPLYSLNHFDVAQRMKLYNEARFWIDALQKGKLT